MNNLNETLPDLMHRATETLEPESTDLVERGIRRGTTLRRRRTVLRGLTGATAVLATAGIVVGGTQLFGSSSPAEPPAASGTTPSAKAPAATPTPVTPAQTLDTLLQLVPANLKQSAPKSSDADGYHRASVVVNDGRGASLLTVALASGLPLKGGCAGLHGKCTVQPDGTVVASYANESIFPYDATKNPQGVKNTVLEIFRPDGTLISLYSYNAPKEIGVQHTRENPLLSVADLTRIANSESWAYPAKYVPTAKPDPGAGYPTVPLAQTLQTLKDVLPGGLQFTRPETWGGGAENGHNGASYVINDGKGKSQVGVLVMRENAITTCANSVLRHCKVRPDGAVVSWSTNEPEYSDSRQQIDGVLANRIEIHYPDGRYLGMWSYNGPQEKGAKHTRVKPALTTDQLLAMAGDKAWKFPGTGTK
ncbi:MAG TPA: hypothetical protein VFG33_32450 [Kribbella sp.]|uniref:hypothetical protein n=1 Tax=Kribbella sp. TaxID=1871183 RepID=UPI002D76B7DC|nr:hypothetical protein [Kribbella sp.]HET6298133.1 hypothetical protein [Kribbella sp.]